MEVSFIFILKVYMWNMKLIQGINQYNAVLLSSKLFLLLISLPWRKWNANIRIWYAHKRCCVTWFLVWWAIWRFYAWSAGLRWLTFSVDGTLWLCRLHHDQHNMESICTLMLFAAHCCTFSYRNDQVICLGYGLLPSLIVWTHCSWSTLSA